MEALLFRGRFQRENSLGRSGANPRSLAQAVEHRKRRCLLCQRGTQAKWTLARAAAAAMNGQLRTPIASPSGPPNVSATQTPYRAPILDEADFSASVMFAQMSRTSGDWNGE
jgi:hypothetical protein